MVIRPKHVAVIIELNIQNSVALDGNPEPNHDHKYSTDNIKKAKVKLSP
jgi:hypothetical protein